MTAQSQVTSRQSPIATADLLATIVAGTRRIVEVREAAESRADLEISKEQSLAPGDFYPLLPPKDDILYVRTTSDTPSISIHLLANDTACVWRHKFDQAAGTVSAFRSGYANAECEEDIRVKG